MSRVTRIARSLCADSPEREQLFNDYIKMISFDGQREIGSKYVEHLRKQFMETPLSELSQKIEQDKEDIVYEKQRWETLNMMRVRQEERDKVNLRTKTEEYSRTDDTFERAICSDSNPQCEKNGMPAYGDEISFYNNELKGYHGVHVGGSGWLGIMVRDQYCEGKNSYLYEIDTAPVYNSKKPFYVMEDFHVMDRTETPNSDILFSRYPVIPAKLIILKKIIPVSKIKPAPDLY